MLQVPEIRAPDDDEDDDSSSSGPQLTITSPPNVPDFSLQVPTQEPPEGGGGFVTLQVPSMDGDPPFAGRLEPPKTLHLSLPPMGQPGLPSLLQVPSAYPRRRHSWICGYVSERETLVFY
ncbi:uncharacterized protein LOC135225646 [Macrobrachium nipponense]|uniref:uncharacterized protein LOC135225646 n=1 Tax=Macrobrachium nipponense TaxID=159736 RepID=UPI0030C8282C